MYRYTIYIEAQSVSKTSSSAVIETTNIITEPISSTTINISQTKEETTQSKETTSEVQTETKRTTTISKTVKVNKTDFKSYMPYTAITNKASKQYKLQQQAYTDKNGLRCIDGRPMVAVGTGWGLSVGDMALVTCENGNSFEVIIGDIKADVDTNSDNKTTTSNNCRCEFIVDMGELNSTVKRSGNMAVFEEYNGYVINVQKIDSIKD